MQEVTKVTVTEMIKKSQSFVNEFVAKLNDATEKEEAKTVFFMDNQDKLTKIVGMLQNIVTEYVGKDSLTAEENVDLEAAKAMVNEIKTAVSAYQQSLAIDSNIMPEDVEVKLTEDTIKDAMTNDKTTQQIAKDLQDIADKQANAGIGYNYALVTDGNMDLFQANTKEDVLQTINAIVKKNNPQTVGLYKINFEMVPLKTETIISF